MTTYNTGNTLGSVDVRDLYDNAQNMDNFSNGSAAAYADRFGVSRQSLQGIRNASQYQVLGPYAAGLVFTQANQVFSYLGEFYAPGPSIVLPYTTTGVGAGEIANFRSVGDAVLRSDLASAASGKGAAIIAKSGQVVPSIAALRLLLKTSASINAFVTGYYAAGDGGGGPYYLDAADTVTADNGGTVIVAADGGRWKLVFAGTISVRQFGAKGDGATNDQPAFQKAIDLWASSGRIGKIHAPSGDYVLNIKAAVPKLTKGLVFYGDGESSILRGGASFSGSVLEVGGAVAAGGAPYEFRDFKIAAPLSGVSNGIKATNANTIRFHGITIQNFVTGFELVSCFAVRFTECLFDVGSSYGIYSGTPAHNMVIDGCRFYTVGGAAGQAIQIDAATDNIAVENCDFEYCRGVYSLTSATAVRLTGNYIEYCTGTEFNHNGAVKGLIVQSNWIALRSGGSSTWNDIDGGSFIANTLYQIAVSFGANVANVEVGINTLQTGGSIAQSPFKSVPSFLNSWVAGARTPGYTKTADGRVSLRGEVTAGTLGNPAFVLPAGFRPTQQLRVPASSGASGNVFGAFIIDTNGNVVPVIGSPISLDGISFV